MSIIVDYEQPRESNLSKSAVDELAANVAGQIGYEPGTDLTSAVQSLGGVLVIQDILTSNLRSSGSIRVEEDNSFRIYLASHTGPLRDRFTIAHEIGHYVLHYLWPNRSGRVVRRLEAQRYGTGRVEWEANWFAAGFLMPADDFRRKFAEFDGNIAMIAAHYGVSAKAAEIRVEYLGLATA